MPLKDAVEKSRILKPMATIGEMSSVDGTLGSGNKEIKVRVAPLIFSPNDLLGNLRFPWIQLWTLGI